MIVYSLSKTSAKNYQNRLMCVEVIVCYISVIFKDTVYVITMHQRYRPTVRRTNGQTDVIVVALVQHAYIACCTNKSWVDNR